MESATLTPENTSVDISEIEKIAKKYYISWIRISLILFLLGPSLTFASLMYAMYKGGGNIEYTIFYGLSIAGAYAMVKTLVAWNDFRKGTEEYKRDSGITDISNGRAILEAIILLVCILCTAAYAFFYFVPSSYTETREIATSVESTVVEGWYEAGKESGVILFSMPSAPYYEWSIWEIDTASGTKPVHSIYYESMIEEELYAINVEWLNDENGNPMYFPTLEESLGYTKSWFSDGEVTPELQKVTIGGVEGDRYSFTQGDQKLVGVYFIRNGKYYDVYVWPGKAENADVEFEKLLSSLKFTD